MPNEYKELICRDIGADCDFIAQGETVEEVIEKCAAHSKNNHGVMSFPPDWYLKMRAHVRTVQT